MNIAQETIKDICGIRDGLHSKGSMSLQVYMLNTVTKKIVEVKESVFTLEPFYTIERHDNFLQLDIRFRDINHEDMKKVWSAMELYGNLLDQYADNMEKLVMATITLVPIESEHANYVSINQPIFWALQPDKIGEECNTIRVVVDSMDFRIMEALNENDINT